MGYHPPLIRVRPAPRGAVRRVTIAVPSKEVPKAVTRNRIRRRIRAALREVGISPSHSLTLVGTSGVSRVAFRSLVEELRSIIL